MKSEIRQEYPLLQLAFDIVLEVLATTIRKEKKKNSIKIGREEVKLSLSASDTIYI